MTTIGEVHVSAVFVETIDHVVVEETVMMTETTRAVVDETVMMIEMIHVAVDATVMMIEIHQIIIAIETVVAKRLILMVLLQELILFQMMMMAELVAFVEILEEDARSSIKNFMLAYSNKQHKKLLKKHCSFMTMMLFENLKKKLNSRETFSRSEIYSYFRVT